MKSISSIVEELHMAWSTQDIKAFQKLYHHDFHGYYCHQKITIKEILNRVEHLKQHYKKCLWSTISTENVKKNQILVFAKTTLLDFNEVKSIILHATLYEVLNNKVYRSYSASDLPINLLLAPEEKEDLTLRTSRKRQLSNHIKEYQKVHSLSKNISNRELDCLYYYLLGFSFALIGTHLDIKASTVETHLSSIVQKLELSNKYDLRNKFAFFDML